MSTIERRTAEPYDMDETRGTAYDQNGWLTFAGLTILFVGMWSVVDGFIAIFRSAYFTGTPVFGTIFFWGSVWIGIGVLQFVAGSGIMAGRTWARWFGIVMVGVSLFSHMFAIAAYPWWSLFVIAMDLFIFYALTVHWQGRVTSTRTE
jgi:hypothetical protein